MERIEYDPEIDPSIREEREAQVRERELSARIRLEIERYVDEHDLVPRDTDDDTDSKNDPDSTLAADNTDDTQRPGAAEERSEETPRQKRERERTENRRINRGKRTARTAERRKAIGSVFTGSILSSDMVRRMWPYLVGIAAMLILYIAYNFHLQRLHLEHQTLERQVRELGIRAVAKTAEREKETRRSAIVERLAEKNIPLEEFPYPVKTIER